MKAVLGQEDNDGIGIRVIDNNEGSHGIVVGFQGDIKHHSCDDYQNDAHQRDPESNEHSNQARRYARYFVHKEQGYETFPWDENLPRIEAVGETIAELSSEEFEQYFGEFYEAVSGSVSSEDEMGVSDFFSALNRDVSAYAIDVFLNESDEIIATSDVLEIYVAPNGEPVLDIDGNPTDITTPTKNDGQLPDARIELVPLPLPSLDLFQQLLVHQTRCQIRDYHIVMGEEPPEEYRVLGFGKYKFAVKYRNDDLPMYEDYTRLDADIPGYSLGFDFSDDPEMEQQVQSFLQMMSVE